MSVALVPANSRVLVEINELRSELERIVSLPELREASSKLRGFDAYAKARSAKEESEKINEARVWTERRAGEVALAEGLSAASVRSTLGVPLPEVSRWFRLARTPLDVLEQAIEGVKGRTELTVSAVERHLAGIEEPTSDPNIFRLPDGRYRAYWKRSGDRLSKVFPADLTLSQVKGKVTRLRRSAIPGSGTQIKLGQLSRAYSHVRQSLWALDHVTQDKELPADAREAVTAAIASLHTAEDAIGKARKLS